MTVDELMDAIDQLDPDSRVELAWRLWNSIGAYGDDALWQDGDPDPTIEEQNADPREVLPQLVSRIRNARMGFDRRHCTEAEET